MFYYIAFLFIALQNFAIVPPLQMIFRCGGGAADQGEFVARGGMMMMMMAVVAARHG